MAKAYFISDLHLGAAYIDDARAHEKRVVEFLRSIAADATHLYMLGDVLDYWYEYRTVVPRGYVRFLGELARLSDAGVKIVWMTGNHDIWLYDYIRDEIGVEVIDAPLICREVCGREIVMGHGDRIGRRKFGFRVISKLFRSRICQRLYASIHPRWTVGFAHNWSSHSRRGGGAEGPAVSEKVIADAAEAAATYPGAEYIVLGHSHLAFEHRISENLTLISLGDWITQDTYAVLADNAPMRLERFEASSRL